MKILIIDDDQTSATLLLSFLKEQGECRVATNGVEGLDSIKLAMEAGEPFDLICLDIVMPEIDGHETLRTIREFEDSTYNITGKKAKIIMTSARDDMGTIMQSFRDLCDGYLVKPLRKNDILLKMKEAGLELAP